MGAARDGGLKSLAASTALTADAALSLIDQIQSQDQRMDAVLQTAQRLSWVDPEQAKILLRRQPLNPRRQQQLEQMLQNQPPRRFR